MMELLHTLPKEDGFYMPAEFSPHAATILIWPVRPGSWGKDPAKSQETFLNIIRNIAKSEQVYLLADTVHREAVRKRLPAGVEVLEIESDDAWARDVAPTFLTDGKQVRGVSWEFNAWGGAVDGLYASWDRDNAVSRAVLSSLCCPGYDGGGFVLEGGSIHSDGEGTILTTKSCLLSTGRNPMLTKKEIEEKLKQYLGAEKVLWLPRGIYQDETNEHVDNVCAFIAPGEVVLAYTENRADPQYELSKACLDYLEAERDAKGRRLIIHKLPIPDVPVCVSESDVKGYIFEEGEDVRKAGERLAASYVNFYFTNETVLVPQFGGENKESDRRAVKILQSVCHGRTVVGIDSRIILMGGGNIHCITQQVPRGEMSCASKAGRSEVPKEYSVLEG